MSHMEKFKAYDEVTHPSGTFEKKGDTIMVTGELLWVSHNAQYIQDGKNDKPGKYTASCKISKKEFTRLSKLKFGPEKRKLCGLKKVMVLDDDGDKTDDIDFYQITMSQFVRVKDRKTEEWKDITVPAVMYNNPKKQIPEGIAHGSQGRIKGSLYISDFEGKPQMSINLMVIQVWDLIPFGGDGSGDGLGDFDFEMEEEDEIEEVDEHDISHAEQDAEEETSEENGSDAEGDDPFAD